MKHLTTFTLNALAKKAMLTVMCTRKIATALSVALLLIVTFNVNAQTADCSCVNSTSNLLTNGSFESGSTGWSVSGGSLTTGNGFVVCGSQNGFLNWSSGTAKLWQHQAGQAGYTYTFKGYAGTHTPGISCSPKLSLLFLNASGAIISTTNVTVTKDVDVTGNNLTLYTLTAVAPVGTVTVRPEASITCNTLKLDALCLTVSVPPAGSGSIGDRVWLDANGNGLQDASETGGITGVTVQLKNSGGTVVATTTTNGTGNYIFSSLVAGNYTVVFPTNISGTVVTPQNVGTNDAIDSDASPTTGATPTISLTTGQVITNVDAGYCPTTLQLGNRVWFDANANGINDSESGIASVTVNLYKDNNNDNYPDTTATGDEILISSTITNASGYYLFSNLSPGNYIVGVMTPVGFVRSSINGGDPDNDINLDNNGIYSINGGETVGFGITLIAGTENDATNTNTNSNLTYDFGFVTHSMSPDFCTDTFLSNSNGYYGGFEIIPHTANLGPVSNPNPAGSELTLISSGNISADKCIIASNANAIPGGIFLAPHSGNWILLLHPKRNNERLWFKSVNVTPGRTYTFCAWGAGAKATPSTMTLKLYMNGLNVGTGTITNGGTWTQVCGSYTVPAGVTTMEISIQDPTAGDGGPSHFVSLDDICFVDNTPSTNPDFNSTFVNVSVSGNVKTNDNVPAGTTYGTSPTLLSSPAGSVATLTMNSTGTYSFTANTIGVYTYNVPVCVPGQSAPCPPTKLTITVLGSGITTNAPVANVDIATTNFNTPVTLKTLANDAAGNPNNSLVPSSVVVTVAPLRGTTSVNSTTGDITYTPNAGFTGSDTLTYRVCDNQSPAKCATALQIITVKASGNTVNTTVAADDYKITTINTPASGNVKTNDSDAEGNTQTVTAQTTTVTGKGTLVLNTNGTYTFTPVTGFTGPVDFVYTTCDNGIPQACATATLHILVKPIAPTTNPDFNSTFVNVSVSGNVNTNDNVPAGTTYGTSPTLLSSPSGSVATLTMNSNGTYSFTANTIGVYTYDVPVCVPGQSAPCPPTKLVITVLGANSNVNAPVANVDITTTNFNTPVTLKTLANDAAGNPSNSLVPSSVVVTVAPLNGTTSVNATTGDITYTPNAGFVGVDTLTYRVCDNQTPAKCATALQIITVKPSGTTNNTTAAADDYKITLINTAVTGNVKTNDSDAEGNTQTVTAQTTTVAGKGTLVLAADGSYTFTPVNGFTGPVDYVYTTCDNGTPQACASATLHILVKPIGDLPDLTPSIFNNGTTLVQNSTRDNVIRIFNIGVGPTTAPFTFTIPKMLPSFEITINPTETSMNVFGGTAVSNSSFTITEQSTRFVITSKPGVVIPAGSSIAIGVKVKAIGIINSTGNLSVQIVFGTGGGETPFNNNVDNNTYSVN